jgi:hypothetical protein
VQHNSSQAQVVSAATLNPSFLLLLLLLPCACLPRPAPALQEDFFRDLEKEVNDWSKKRSESGQPASLWEELSAIGEEFVDFLEAGLGEDFKQQQERGKGGSSNGGSTEFNHPKGKARTPMDKYEELKRQYDLYDEGLRNKASGGGSSSSGSSSSNGTGR